jgi:acyl carrier protein
MDFSMLRTIITEALELPEQFALTPDTRISQIPGWDSMAWISVITAIEEASGNEFPLDRVDEIKTLSNLLSSVIN